MNSIPNTRPSLLLRLREPSDCAAWNEFVEIYVPIIYGYARRRGLQDADAADVVQDVLRQVSSSIKKFEYAPERGAFRSWLLTVTRTRLCNFMNRRDRATIGSGDDDVHAQLENSPAAQEELDQWDHEYQQRLCAVAMQRAQIEFRESTWQAFHLTATEGLSAKSVAQSLGLSVGAVYIAKSRVLTRLKEIASELSDESISPLAFASATV